MKNTKIDSRKNFEIYCQRFNTTISDFSNYLSQYETELKEFKKDFGPERQTSTFKDDSQ